MLFDGHHILVRDSNKLLVHTPSPTTSLDAVQMPPSGMGTHAAAACPHFVLGSLLLVYLYSVMMVVGLRAWPAWKMDDDDSSSAFAERSIPTIGCQSSRKTLQLRFLSCEIQVYFFTFPSSSVYMYAKAVSAAQGLSPKSVVRYKSLRFYGLLTKLINGTAKVPQKNVSLQMAVE